MTICHRICPCALFIDASLTPDVVFRHELVSVLLGAAPGSVLSAGLVAHVVCSPAGLLKGFPGLIGTAPVERAPPSVVTAPPPSPDFARNLASTAWMLSAPPCRLGCVINKAELNPSAAQALLVALASHALPLARLRTCSEPVATMHEGMPSVRPRRGEYPHPPVHADAVGADDNKADQQLCWDAGIWMVSLQPTFRCFNYWQNEAPR